MVMFKVTHCCIYDSIELKQENSELHKDREAKIKLEAELQEKNTQLEKSDKDKKKYKKKKQEVQELQSANSKLEEKLKELQQKETKAAAVSVTTSNKENGKCIY